MHILIVNFKLAGIDERQYAAMCDEVAPAFASVPGLLSKVWLKDSARGVYGGVYTFESRAAFERYTESDLFKSVAAHPNFADATAHDFGVLEAPTQITHGLLVAAS